MTEEEAVRNYLTFLRDPSALRDEASIKRHAAAVEKAKDPVAEALARAALKEAESVDESVPRARFVEHARNWAEANSVPASVFVEMGVPTDVLAEAGISVGRRGGRKAATKTRSSRVRAEDVRAVAASIKGPFTTGDLQQRSGGSPGTIRKVIAEMTSAGEIVSTGPHPDWKGRGRPPIRYEAA
jgi:hypothetical protein